MNIAPIAKLFEIPTHWPPLPPWWLVSSTDVAAFLNISPKTLHTWRVRSFGPPVFPPMYHRPTQGMPLYYQYGHLRAWVAERLGLVYDYTQQCEAYLAEHAGFIAKAKGSMRDKIDAFESFYRSDRQKLRAGRAPTYFETRMIEEIDLYYARQPKMTAVSCVADQTG
jgi:hypothetical protein